MGFLSRQRPLKRLGSFKIIEKLGEGGMCTVYRAVQASLDRPVAIKVLQEKLGNDPTSRERFERESTIIARLSHPNIVHVIDRGLTPDGCPYFAMELVEGTSLAEALAEERLGTDEKLEIAIQICRALAYAHKNGVIHRDIKPANVVLDPEGNAIVLDFGIAKITDPDGQTLVAATRTDLVLGTLAYMSPEQQSGRSPLTPASDLYSLGVVLYEMFTGERPVGRFRRPSEIDPSLPPGLDEIILRCLEPDPEARFASAGRLRDRLLEISQGAHLATEERERAGTGLERIREKFALLDVIREEATGALYLYQHKADRRLLVIRKRVGSAAGLAEAKLLGAIPHRRIAGIVGASGDERRFIVVMEYLQGGSLKDRILQALPPEEVLRIGREAAEGLAFAHRNRVFHGSLRPENLLFSDGGAVKIADFGFDEHTAQGSDPYNPFNEPRSLAADILALGIILFQAATGFLPAWRSETLVLYPQFLRLPRELREVLTGMLALKPQARIASCDLVAGRFYRAESELTEDSGLDERDDATVIESREDRTGDTGPGRSVGDSRATGEVTGEARGGGPGLLGRVLGRRKVGT